MSDTESQSFLKAVYEMNADCDHEQVAAENRLSSEKNPRAAILTGRNITLEEMLERYTHSPGYWIMHVPDNWGFEHRG